jgi:hypothetical protein
MAIINSESFFMRTSMLPAPLRKALPECYDLIVNSSIGLSMRSCKKSKRGQFMKLGLASFWGASIVVIALLVLTGCSTTIQSTIVSEWINPSYNSPAFDRIMVGSSGEQDSIRRNLEDEFVAQLKTAGIHALPGYRYAAGDDKIEDTGLKEAAQRAGTDAAIVVRSINVEQKTHVPPAVYPTVGIFGQNVGATWSGIPAAPVYRYRVYTSEVTLYDLKKNETVWTGSIRTTEPDNVNTAIKNYVATVIKALTDKKLLGAKK